MLSPSDFNNAVPQFTNGDYASNPINPQYIAEPDAVDYNRGAEPLQTLPAQWWNWFINRFTNRFNKVNVYVKNIFNELSQLLSLVSESPSGTEAEPTIGQLKDMFENKYPSLLSDKFVTKTTKVNGHELSSDVTVSKSDVGLGNVVNTGDSATPTSGGTTKFTTGGAYTELAKKAPTNHASTGTGYGVATTANYGHVKKGFGLGGQNINVTSAMDVDISSIEMCYLHNSSSTKNRCRFYNRTGGQIIYFEISTNSGYNVTAATSGTITNGGSHSLTIASNNSIDCIVFFFPVDLTNNLCKA